MIDLLVGHWPDLLTLLTVTAIAVKLWTKLGGRMDNLDNRVSELGGELTDDVAEARTRLDTHMASDQVHTTCEWRHEVTGRLGRIEGLLMKINGGD